MPSLRMTDRGLRALTTGKAQEDFYDPSLPGFVLRVARGGAKTFYFRYRNGAGRYCRVRLGAYPLMSLADAREQARARQVQVDNGEDPAEERVREREAPTLEHLAREYVERYAKRRKRSWAGDQRMLQNHVVPRLGAMKVTELKKRHFFALLEDLVAAGKPILSNRVLRVLSKMFNWAVEVELVETSPCQGIRPLAREQKRERVLSEAEVRALWRRLDAEEPAIAGAFRLLLLTGQRSGEVTRMRWEDIDQDVWTIPAEFSKSGQTHVVPLSSPAQAIVKSFGAQNPVWVFGSPRGEAGLAEKTLSHAVIRLRPALGFPHWTPHDLRRTVASRMAEMGIEEFHIARVLGHSYNSVTAIYNRYSYLAEKRAALEKWGQRLMEIVGAEGAEAAR